MESKVFKCKAYDKLLRWKTESNGRTAMLVEGARRVGKSTLVEHFALYCLQKVDTENMNQHEPN